VLSVVTLVVIEVLRNDRSAVNSALSIRGTIVALSAMLTFRFTVPRVAGLGTVIPPSADRQRSHARRHRGDHRSARHVPFVDEARAGLCGLLLISVVALVNDHRLRALVSAK
jgi:hypothetical protein